MSKKIWLLQGMLLLAIAVPGAMALDNIKIEPVWEKYNAPIGHVNPEFPIMIARDGAFAGEGCGGQVPGYENTKFDMDLVSSLIRYDKDRLLLFLVENGINEDKADHDQALAAKYPDRSLWWINASNGSPIGIALEPLKYDGGGVTFTRGGVTYKTLDLWPTSDFFVERALDDRARSFRPDLMQSSSPKVEVDAEGNLYLSDRHMLVRYEADGQGGFKAPTLAFEYPKINPPVMPDGTVVTDGHYRSWAIQDVNIIGEGQNKIMTTAGRHWLDGAGIMYYTSEDGGKTFKMRSYKGQDQRGGIVGTGGACSEPIVIGATEYVFGTGFPGSDGYLYKMERPIGDPAGKFLQAQPPYWNYTPQDLDTSKGETQRFMAWQMTDVAAKQGAPFAAVLSIPKWKSLYEDWTAQGGPPTAWIALVSYDDRDGDGMAGDLIGSYQIPWKDADEPNIPGADFDENAGAAWQNVYQVEINLDILDDGGVEILVSGGGIGYARYKVDYETSVLDWSVF
ncbi:MAG: hypothetical protein AB1656_01365 [Candidatus Omnitrophota bacterium]